MPNGKPPAVAPKPKPKPKPKIGGKPGPKVGRKPAAPPGKPPQAPIGPAPPVKKNPIATIPAPKANPSSIIRFEKQLTAAMAKMKKAKANWPSRLEKIRNGVVQLRVVQEKFLWSMPYRTPLKETVFGSGWFIDNSEFGVNTGTDVLIVTNAHVAKQASEITVLVQALGQEPIAAEAVGICVQRDIALLRVKDPVAMFALFKQRTGSATLIKMKLGDSDKMLRGAPVMAVGYPLGMQSVKASVGIVSGYQQFPTALYLSITAPINPGNSGGPLYNEGGQVVGINSAKFAKASGISFAIPSNQLRVTLDALYTTRQFLEPELGLQYSTGTNNINEFLSGAKSKGGVFVKKVMAGGLYAAAGGAKNDLILAIDDHKVDRFGKIWMKKLKDRFNMNGLLLRHKLGAPMSFHVFRGGKLLKLTTAYKATKQTKVHHIYEPIVKRPRFVSVAGFIFMELNLNLVQANLQGNPAELVTYMRPENRNEQRILITNIVPASLAAKDGSAKKGLLLSKVNGRAVTTMDQLCSALSAKVAPNDFWTIETSKSFTAFRVKDVTKYQAQHKASGGASSKPQFSGC
jgi:S1-C subfamily serine protease